MSAQEVQRFACNEFCLHIAHRHSSLAFKGRFFCVFSFFFLFLASTKHFFSSFPASLRGIARKKKPRRIDSILPLFFSRNAEEKVRSAQTQIRCSSNLF